MAYKELKGWIVELSTCLATKRKEKTIRLFRSHWRDKTLEEGQSSALVNICSVSRGAIDSVSAEGA